MQTKFSSTLLGKVGHLPSLLVRLFVQMKAKVADGRQVVELKVLSPEDGVGAGLAGGAGVQHVVQAQLAVVALLSRELTGFNYPQFQHIVHPPAIVLHEDETSSNAVYIT